MAKLIQLPGARPADEGEALVVRYLREALPETYTLIPNIEIAEPGRPLFEYDLIIVGPHAVYVVEVKRWLGGIRGDDHTWWIAGEHQRNNPWPTVNLKSRVVKSQIQRLQPICDPLWVEALVAIADDQGELDLQGRCRDRCFRYRDLPHWANGQATCVPGGRTSKTRSRRQPVAGRLARSGLGTMKCWRPCPAVTMWPNTSPATYCCAARIGCAYVSLRTTPICPQRSS